MRVVDGANTPVCVVVGVGTEAEWSHCNMTRAT